MLDYFDVIFGDILVSRRPPTSEFERELPFYHFFGRFGGLLGLLLRAMLRLLNFPKFVLFQ